MTLRRRVLAITAVGVVAVLVLGGWLTYRFVRAADVSRSITTSVQPAADATATLATALSDAKGFVSTAVLDAALDQSRPVDAGSCADPFTCYDAAMRAASDSLAVVRESLPEDAEVQSAATATQNAITAWQETDPNLVFPLLTDDQVRVAAEVTRSATAQSTYDAATVSVIGLQRLIDNRRSAATDEFTTMAQRLAWALGIAIAVLLLLLLLGLLALTSWVLTPLDRLREQLRAAATPEGRYRPISPSGPPELEATGTDAELMRRQLVAQIDDAVAARQGLDQQGPVVAAIRAELEATDDRVVAGLEVAGALQPAEGVLAGDWWDVLRLADGRAAVVVTDVAGHGPVAGIGAVRLKNTIGVALVSGLSPDEALRRAALAFRDEQAQFATCALMLINPSDGLVTWANAGHPPPVVRRPDGTVTRLEPTGPLISGLGGTWECRTLTLSDDDLLLAWSDGLVESRDQTGAELGEQGLLAMVEQALEDEVPPSEVVERVLAEARTRAVDWRRDDVTLTAVALAR